MTGAASRNKGKRGELEIVHMLRDNLGIAVNRNYKQVAQAQHGDIEQLVGGYLIEIKNCASVNIKPWWQQACRAASAHPDNPKPCLAYKLAGARAPLHWRFIVPLPQAWASGRQWAKDLQFTQTLYPDGFYLLVREHS